jgi:hypothetical protein
MVTTLFPSAFLVVLLFYHSILFLTTTSRGTFLLLDLALQLIGEQLIEKTGNNVFLPDRESEVADHSSQDMLSLGSIVAVLVSFDLSPQDLLAYAHPYLDRKPRETRE